MNYGMNWAKDFRNVFKIEKKLMEEIGRSVERNSFRNIVEVVNERIPYFIFAQRYKIHYIQLEKVFDICILDIIYM